MKKMLATVALIVATTTSAFAGWQEEVGADRVTGAKTYIAYAEGKAFDPSWYNDETPYIAISCVGGKTVKFSVNYGNEVLTSQSVQYSISGSRAKWMHLQDSNVHGRLWTNVALYSKVFKPETPRYLQKNTIMKSLWDADGGVLVARTYAYDRTPVEIQVDARGFRKMLTKAAAFCGMTMDQTK